LYALKVHENQKKPVKIRPHIGNLSENRAKSSVAYICEVRC